MSAEPDTRWKRGLPPGKVTPKMLEDYEAHPTPMGWVYRRRPTQKKESVK